MLDSDIIKTASIIDINGKQYLDCRMAIPYEPIKRNPEAYSACGDFLRLEGEAEDILDKMGILIRRVKHVG